MAFPTIPEVSKSSFIKTPSIVTPVAAVFSARASVFGVLENVFTPATVSLPVLPTKLNAPVIPRAV